MMTGTTSPLPPSADAASGEAAWMRAIQGLHERYYLLADGITWFRHEQETSPNALLALRESKHIEELGLLQQEVMAVLCDLLAELPGADLTTAPPLTAQLSHHTRALQEVNQRVDAALARLCLKNPAFQNWLQHGQ